MWCSSTYCGMSTSSSALLSDLTLNKIMDAVSVARAHGIPVIADGGMQNSGGIIYISNTIHFE